MLSAENYVRQLEHTELDLRRRIHELSDEQAELQARCESLSREHEALHEGRRRPAAGEAGAGSLRQRLAQLLRAGRGSE